MRLYDNYESQAKRFQKNFSTLILTKLIIYVYLRMLKIIDILQNIVKTKKSVHKRHFFILHNAVIMNLLILCIINSYFSLYIKKQQLLKATVYSNLFFIKACRQITTLLIQPLSQPFCFGHLKSDSLLQTQPK